MKCLLYYVCGACGSRAVFVCMGQIIGNEVQIEGTDQINLWASAHRLPQPDGAEINVG